jgi:hypothetical protein
MVSPEYKVTIVRSGSYEWLIEVWEHPTIKDLEYGPWRCIARRTAPNLEGHGNTRWRLGMALRGLAALGHR